MSTVESVMCVVCCAGLLKAKRCGSDGGSDGDSDGDSEASRKRGGASTGRRECGAKQIQMVQRNEKIRAFPSRGGADQYAQSSACKSSVACQQQKGLSVGREVPSRLSHGVE